MRCEPTRAVLLGESPPVGITEHLCDCQACRTLQQELLAVDDTFAALPPPAVPAELLDAVRAELRAEVALEDAIHALTPPAVPAALRAETKAAMSAEASDNVVPLWRRRRAWGGLAAAAAVLLLLRPPTTDVGDPSQFIEKGDGTALPDVALGVAVQSGQSTERLRADRRYVPGDVLYFRSSTDRTATVLLVRIDESGADVIHHEQLGSGSTDLPLSWTIEPGEGDAFFALLASSDPLQDTPIESVLSTWPQPPCEQAHGLGLSCESVFVGMSLTEVAP